MTQFNSADWFARFGTAVRSLDIPSEGSRALLNGTVLYLEGVGDDEELSDERFNATQEAAQKQFDRALAAYQGRDELPPGSDYLSDKSEQEFANALAQSFRYFGAPPSLRDKVIQRISNDPYVVQNAREYLATL